MQKLNRPKLVGLWMVIVLSSLLTVVSASVAVIASPPQLQQIGENIWVHTTWTIFEGQPTPSNGLLLVTGEGLVLIDTAWDDAATRDLLRLAQERFGAPVRLVIITHAHEDRLGGIRTLLGDSIPVVSTGLTASLAERQGYPKPEPRLTDQYTVLEVGGVRMEVYFPGQGHTVDNVTVWLTRDRVLFTGCLVKAALSTSIGNSKDANLAEWPKALGRLLEKYPQAQTVIPGHGQWGGTGLIRHTLALLEQEP